MAAELKETLNVTFTPTGLSTSFGSASSVSIDVSGSAYSHKVQTVGTTAEAIGVDDAGTTGTLYVKNLSAVTVTLSVNDGTNEISFAILATGRRAAFPRANVTYKAAAASSTANLEILVVPA